MGIVPEQIELTQQDLDHINKLCGESTYGLMACWSDVKYRCFDKTRAIYNGSAIVRVYMYLELKGYLKR